MMKDFRFVKADTNRKVGWYALGNMHIKGFVTEHGTDGLYWFNTQEGIDNDKRDLLVSATDIKVVL